MKSAVDALSTELGSVVNPRVVVGVPPSEPPAGDADVPSIEAKGTIDVPSTSTGIDALEKADGAKPASSSDPEKPSFDATLALGSSVSSEVEEKEDNEKTAEEKSATNFASTLAFGSATEQTLAPEDAPPAKEAEKADFAATLALGSSEPAPASVDAAQPAAPVKVSEEPIPEPKRVEASELAATTTGKKNEKKKAASAPANVDPDEISVPPIGDVSVDEHFFSEGDVHRHLDRDRDALEGEALTIPDKARRKAEPHVVERRARFVRYVKWAVAGAGVVCVAALARTTMSSSSASSATPVRSTASMTMEVQQQAAAVAPKAAAPAATPIAEPTTAASASAAPPSEPAPTTADTAAATPPPEPATAAAATPTTETKPEEITGDAKEEKVKARTLLEKRKLADAIEAGERSVKLDPSDGEAWLILGAAYQEKGNMVQARRAYASCVKDATTGPRQECAKMLR